MSRETAAVTSSGWQRRRVLSASLRVAATLVPIVLSFVSVIVLNGVLPHASGVGQMIGRTLALAVCSILTLALTDKAARRFLPLAALLQLSLVFPDQTPSRFRTALKGGSGRRLAREVAQARRDGLSDDPSRAAEQLLMLATAIGDHDRRTRGHSERVRLYTDLIAEELHLSVDERSRLQWAALIHDIGKIEVPPTILNKKGAPDAREWSVLKRHPLAGERLVEPVEGWLGDAVHAVGGHHERWDGSGYPRGLKGDAIARSASIVAVADAFEVMTAVRSYKKAMPLSAARAELTRCAGTHFNPDVVRALLNVSIGRLRRSMGIVASIAHLPFLGQVSKVAAYAPDSVSTAVGFTTTTATAGVGVIALSSGLAVASPPVPPVPTPTVPTSATSSVASGSRESTADVAAAETRLVTSSPGTTAVPATTIDAPSATEAPTTTTGETTIPAPPATNAEATPDAEAPTASAPAVKPPPPAASATEISPEPGASSPTASTSPETLSPPAPTPPPPTASAPAPTPPAQPGDSSKDPKTKEKEKNDKKEKGDKKDKIEKDSNHSDHGPGGEGDD